MGRQPAVANGQVAIPTLSIKDRQMQEEYAAGYDELQQMKAQDGYSDRLNIARMKTSMER